MLKKPIDVDISLAGGYGTAQIGDPPFIPGVLTPATIPAGTVVNSYFLHGDAESLDLGPLRGSVTFDTDILGVMVLTGSLDFSDGLLGASGTMYPKGDFRGLELGWPVDNLNISDDRRTLKIEFDMWLGAMDQIRVITGGVVDIDVKPCSYPNSINLKSNGLVPVAVLSTEGFDATTIDDPSALRFAGASPVRWTHEDVGYDCGENDGYVDLLLFFKKKDLKLDESSTEAILIGAGIMGMDTVNVVGSSQGEGKAKKPVSPLAQPSTWGKVKDQLK